MNRQDDERTFVTFKLEGETYALPISKVREVLEFNSVTKVPQMPPFVRGMINLRGNVLPVVDLRIKFAMGRTEGTVETRVIVVDLTVDGEPTLLGALADSVEDVIDLAPGEIGPPPKIGARLRTEFIRGIGHRDGDFVILLDIEQVFTVEELSQVGQVEHAANAQVLGSDDTTAVGAELAAAAPVPPMGRDLTAMAREDG